LGTDHEIVNKAFRAVLIGIEEVVGHHGMATLLRQSGLSQYISNFPPSTMDLGGHRLKYVSQLYVALYDIYGRRGARAILQRVGHSIGKSSLDENPALVTATGLALKLMSQHRRAKLVLDTIVKAYSEQLFTTPQIKEEDDAFVWEEADCDNCIEWSRVEFPVCYATAGFLAHLLEWATGGREFSITEVNCRAMGDEVCRFRVNLSQRVDG
jgi:predicted hydrocarbon binding protein